MTTLEQRITDKSARVAVVGLGYVGFPLARRATEAGYQVVGIRGRYVWSQPAYGIGQLPIDYEDGFKNLDARMKNLEAIEQGHWPVFENP